jgi:hypothetical protein
MRALAEAMRQSLERRRFAKASRTAAHLYRCPATGPKR